MKYVSQSAAAEYLEQRAFNGYTSITPTPWRRRCYRPCHPPPPATAAAATVAVAVSMCIAGGSSGFVADGGQRVRSAHRPHVVNQPFMAVTWQCCMQNGDGGGVATRPLPGQSSAHRTGSNHWFTHKLLGEPRWAIISQHPVSVSR